MDNAKAPQLDLLTISPFVRYIHHMPDATAENYVVPWRYLYDHELIYVAEGSMTVLTDDESYTLGAGDVHVMPPLVRHRRKIPPGVRCNHYSVHFDIAYMGKENDFSPEEVYIAYCNTDREVVPRDEHLAARPLFMFRDIELPKRQHAYEPAAYVETLSRMCDAFSEKYFAYEIDLKRNMLLLFKLMLHDMRADLVNGHPSAEGDDIATIVQYLYDHMSRPVSFETICRLYGYSMINFRKIFRERTGQPPGDFLIGIRMERAAELLYTGQYTVAQVAEMVGYDDSHYFSRLFRKRRGISPGSLCRSGHPESTDRADPEKENG